MNSSLKLLISSVTLAIMGMSLSACGGADCATNTEENDGECTVTASACGPGTTLAAGKCELNATGCGEGAKLEGGVCVPNSTPAEACGNSTTYDTALGKCVSSVELVECGDNTKLEGDECVPDGVCAGGTTLNTDGQCVVAPASCGTGTQLDPNSGTCVVTDAVCGANTAFDAVSNTCAPQDTVCSTGTEFDITSGLCVPDASVCTLGSVIVNGVCTSPGQVLFDDAATVAGVENDDTDKGGTATAITLAAEGSSVVFKGTIGAAVDVDADNIVDQDYDQYTFAGTAGTYLNLKLQALDGASLSYVVTGPNGYTRFTTLALGANAERDLYLPEDGDYTVTVAPAIVLATDGDVGPLGADTWNYVAELSTLPAITATDIDVTATPITGSFGDLSDNLYKLTNLTTGGIVDVTVNGVGANVEGVMSLWSSPTELIGTFDIESGDTITAALPAGDVYAFFDWSNANGPDLSFDVSVALKTNQEVIGTLTPDTLTSSTAISLLDDESQFYTVTAPAGTFLEISQANPNEDDVDVFVRDAQGNTITTDTFFSGSAASPDYIYVFVPAETTYVVEVQADGDITDFELKLTSVTPDDLGAAAPGDTISENDMDALTSNQASLKKITFASSVELSGTFEANSTGFPQLRFLDAAGTQIYSTSGQIEKILAAGTYYMTVSGFSASDTGYNIDMAVAVGPVSEVEPNNDVATATAVDLSDRILGTISAGDVDVYSFTLAADQPVDETQVLRVVPTGSVSSTDEFTCEVSDSTGAVVSTTTSVVDCTLYLQGLVAGTYTLSVTTTAASINEYFIGATPFTGFIQEVEPNDTSATAMVLTPDFKLFGEIPLDTDLDWYEFTLPAGPDLEFTLSFDTLDLAGDSVFGSLNKQATGTIDVELFDASGTLVSDTIAQSAELLPGGATYRIGITRSSSTPSFTGRYALEASVRVPPALPSLPAPYTSAPGIAIPDNDAAAGITDTLNVPTSCIIQDMLVETDIPHTWQSDVIIQVTSPTGTVITLTDGLGGSADDFIGAFDIDYPTVDSLNTFNGEDAMGDWTMYVADDGGGDFGTFNSWGVSFTCQ